MNREQLYLLFLGIFLGMNIATVCCEVYDFVGIGWRYGSFLSTFLALIFAAGLVFTQRLNAKKRRFEERQENLRETLELDQFLD